jgi:large subunit ribosomal protein L22
MAKGSGVKTNERPGTRAVAKYIRISPYKVREVLDLIRGQHVQRATEILRFTERDAAFTVGKVLASAIANAENNDGIDGEELYVSACYADEGVTIKRFRPRARGRAGRIRKRTCHITVIVSRMPADQLARYRTKQAAEQAARRARRVAGGRAGGVPENQRSTGSNRPGRFRRGGKRGADASEEAALMTDEAAEVVEDAAIENEAEIADAVEAADVETTDEALAEDVVAEDAVTDAVTDDVADSTEEPVEGDSEEEK